MAAGVVLQVIFALCASGTDPDVCRPGSDAAESTIIGPLVHSNEECAYAAFPFIASLQANGDPRMKNKVVRSFCMKTGEGTPPTAQFGKISPPEFKRLD